MAIRNPNAATLNDARLTVAKFESAFGLTSNEMLSCEQGDERLSQIDPFDLMDWHYALDQIQALESGVVELDAAVGSSTHCVRPMTFSYQRLTFTEITPPSDRELLLVA